MARRLRRLAVASSLALSLATVASEPAFVRPNELDSRPGSGGGDGESARRRAQDAGYGADGRAKENIVIREGVLFQPEGCPQLITEEEAMARAKDDSIPGNIVNLYSEGDGRAGNHFVVLSAYFAIGYCCKSKLLKMPRHDDTFPSAVPTDDGRFEADKRFFDFSGVDTLPLEEYEGLATNPEACKPHFELSGMDAWHLWSIHPQLLSCMNRVYIRGCEAAYLEPLLGAERFSYCENPAATTTHGRRLSENDGRQEDARGVTATTTIPPPLATADAATGSALSAPASSRTMMESDPLSSQGRDTGMEEEDSTNERGSGNGVPSRGLQVSGVSEGATDGRRRLRAAGDRDGESPADGGRKLVTADTPPVDNGMTSGLGKRGSAGSLVIHIRSGDIFKHLRPGAEPSRMFLSYGQPPLQFYLRTIASQPWSDVTILTYTSTPDQLNPAFATLEMMQRTGVLGPNVVTHKDRDLLTDIRSMLCADGLAASRSTLHFLTFAHTRAKHIFLPSECGPGTYARGSRVPRDKGPRKKPNPNNATLLCIENPDTEVYGVDWEVDEDAYFLYDNWNSSPEQRLDMVLFDGIKGLSRCCSG